MSDLVTRRLSMLTGNAGAAMCQPGDSYIVFLQWCRLCVSRAPKV